MTKRNLRPVNALWLLRTVVTASILLSGCSKPAADLAACQVEAMRAHIQNHASAPFNVACMRTKGYVFRAADEVFRAGYSSGVAVEWCFDKEGFMLELRTLWMGDNR